MSILKNVLPQLNGLVSEGLNVDNLCKIESLCRGVLVLGEYPVVFYVLENVCRELRMEWDDRALTVDEYNAVRTRLTGPIQSLLESVQLNMGKEATEERLDTLIREFIEVQSHMD